ncbi:MAG: nucleoside/nucleotide kinase family protein [Limisphaerales bacterium]
MLALIGIMGSKGAGKDTVSRMLGFLATESKLTHERLAFADPLKQELAEMLDVPFERINQQKARYRKALQDHGELRRREDPRYWLRRLEIYYQASQAASAGEPGIVTVPDTRHINEIDWIQYQGGLLLRVLNPAVDAEAQKDPHITEHAWRSVTPDMQVTNSGTPGFLMGQVIPIFETLEQALLSRPAR